MDIQKQLRLLREGNSDAGDITDDVIGDDELVESWFINTNDYITESVTNTSITDLVVEMTTLIESGTATPNETLGVLAKISDKMKKFKSKFDPFEGLGELRLIRERIEATATVRKHLLIPFFGPYIGIMKYGEKVKDMDEKDIKAFISEAERMRGVIFNKLSKAKSQNDTPTVEYLDRILGKLDKQINGFKSDMKHFGKM